MPFHFKGKFSYNMVGADVAALYRVYAAPSMKWEPYEHVRHVIGPDGGRVEEIAGEHLVTQPPTMGSTSPAKSRPDPRPTTLSMIFTVMTRALGGASRGDVVSFSATMQAPILAADIDKRSRAQTRLRNWPWARGSLSPVGLVLLEVDQVLPVVVAWQTRMAATQSAGREPAARRIPSGNPPRA